MRVDQEEGVAEGLNCEQRSCCCVTSEWGWLRWAVGAWLRRRRGCGVI